MSENIQKDLVLSINEYAYVLDETKGNVSCWVGPAKTSLSTSDRLVVFNPYTKAFETSTYNKAISLFTTAPENWYVILKNPADKYPTPGTANSLPDSVHVGRKINIKGPVSFALYPGQMAKVVRGHSLRSNQYLLARVYEAESANTYEGEVLDSAGNKIETTTKYVNGQILVIKGTEVSFYIPPTGIEVIPVNNDHSLGYVRDAVTLERLEYCILKDEDGNKRYVHGPKVVFPEPTETFITSDKGSYIFRAIELSKISGIYVKVIAEYTDEKNVVHPVGEEQFITGNDQMIYYPRPEHAIISYDNKIMHHAIAIPEGEGRYIMDRMTGVIKTVKGPAMYLPDPRNEVVVKRKLTENQCKLWYPGNEAALAYNIGLNEKSVEKSLQTINLDDVVGYCTVTSASSTLANLEAKANISRGTSYTKPRTITLDNKFEGVVSIDVWTGYAINVISKSGERKVVCGPQTVLLDYDQTLESLELSTGKPKTADRLLKTAYLRHENNKVSDIITIETKDFVRASIKVSYCVDFDPVYMDKWFAVDNYVKYLCDRQRSLIKKAAKQYAIDDFYQNYVDIVRDIALDKNNNTTTAESANKHQGKHRFFAENGMFVHDVEVLSIEVQSDIEKMLLNHQHDMIQKSLELTNAEKEILITKALSAAEQEKQALRSQELINKLELQRAEALRKLEIQAEVNRKNEAEKVAATEAQKNMSTLLDAINDADLARKKKAHDQLMAEETAKADLEIAKQEAYAKTVKTIIESIGPDLVAALTTKSNSDLLEAVTTAMGPYALAQGESVSEVVNKLLRGTSLEGLISDVNVNV